MKREAGGPSPQDPPLPVYLGRQDEKLPNRPARPAGVQIPELDGGGGFWHGFVFFAKAASNGEGGFVKPGRLKAESSFEARPTERCGGGGLLFSKEIHTSFFLGG